jgi:hypothetical protein
VTKVATLVAVAALWAFTTVAASAQVTPLRLGDVVSGSLGPADRMLGDSARYDTFLLRGSPGERITITLRSEDFDAYLFGGALRGSVFIPAAEDDDGGGDTNARLTITVGADSSYAVRATSYEGGESGAYTLTVIPARLPDEPIPVVQLSVGATVQSRLDATDPELDDGSYYDLYELRGTPGEQVVITLSSSEFDAYLYGGRWDGASWTTEAASDDGGGQRNARLVVRLGTDGSYWIRANSFDPARVGSYTLRAERP